jgi:hypothetical protein
MLGAGKESIPAYGKKGAAIRRAFSVSSATMSLSVITKGDRLTGERRARRGAVPGKSPDVPLEFGLLS